MIPGPGDTPDTQLLEQVRAGHPEAFAVLFERYHRVALSTATRHSRNQADAEDITAEAFTQTYRAIVQGAGPTDSFVSYLLTAVRNNTARAVQQSRRVLPTEHEEDLQREPVPAAEIEFLARAEGEELLELLATLPPRWQSVLWRTEIEGRRPREIAQEWEMSANSVAALARRARAGLRLAYLRSRLPASPPGLPSLCRTVRSNLPDYLRGRLRTGPRMQVHLHTSECRDCAAVLAELKSVSDRLQVLTLPALVLFLFGGAAKWARRTAGAHLGITTAASVSLVAAVIAWQVASPDPEPDPGTGAGPPSSTTLDAPVPSRDSALENSEIVDVTGDADAVDRRYEVRLSPLQAGGARVRFAVPEGLEYLGTFDAAPSASAVPPS